MRVPEPPAVAMLKHLSSSVYEAALVCKARAAWAAFGDRKVVPPHPKALLGTCLHAVVELAHHGRLPLGGGESIHAAARETFDLKAKQLYEQAHPLLRVKFTAADRLPYYHLYRERAALLAMEAAGMDGATTSTTRGGGARAERAGFSETKLASRDGLLVGRPDFLDAATGDVVDYKTGAAPEDDPVGLLDSEARQLRLYVHLGREHGMDLKRGVVVRADGSRVVLQVSEAEAQAEGQRARDVLRAFNAQAPAGFDRLAEPSPEACRYCPCIPFCEPFWEQSAPGWAERCGSHAEGRISSVVRAVVQNTGLLTFEMEVVRGTTEPGRAVTQQLPEGWASADESPLPAVGDLVRVVNYRATDDEETVRVIRPDRLMTALWTVRLAEDVQEPSGPDDG